MITAEWLAGFIDGEGTFGIATHGQSYLQPRFRLNQRDDDSVVVRAIFEFIGVGGLYTKRYLAAASSPNAKSQLGYNLTGRDCIRLIEILDVAPLRTKKARDYAIWREAVFFYVENLSHRWADPSIKADRDKQMWIFKQQIDEARAYIAPEVL